MIDACMPASDRVLTKCRPYDIILDNLYRRGKGPGLEHDGKVFRLIVRESTGDRCFSAGNSLPDGRRGIDSIIENNSQSFPYICRGNLIKNLRAFTVEFNCHIGFIAEITAKSVPERQ